MGKPALAIQTEHGRKYRHPITRREWYSVTTIIDGGVPKPNLAEGAAKKTARYVLDHWDSLEDLPTEVAYDEIMANWNREWVEAATKGDEVHESAEAYALGKPDGKSPRHMRQLEDFFKVSGSTPLYTEVTIVNESVGYAGTADLIATDDLGRHILIDYKSGKNIYPEACLQVEALARGEYILRDDGREEPLPDISYTGILHLRPLSWWFHLNTDYATSERNWKAFSAAKEVSDWRRMHPVMVFGPLPKMNRSNWAA